MLIEVNEKRKKPCATLIKLKAGTSERCQKTGSIRRCL